MLNIPRAAILAGLVAGLIASLFFYFQQVQLTQSTKPLKVTREGRSVSLEYDEEGVGRIEAETLVDAMYAQGYQHAQ